MYTFKQLGVSEAQIKKLNKKNLFTLRDILDFIPRKYYDFRKPCVLEPYFNEQYVAIEGIIKPNSFSYDSSSKPTVLKMNVIDKESNETLHVRWFGAGFLKDKYKYWIGKPVYVCGKLQYHPVYGYSISNPLVFSNKIEESKKIYPIYTKFSGISDDFIAQLRMFAFQDHTIYQTDFLNDDVFSMFSSQIIKHQTQFTQNLLYDIINKDLSDLSFKLELIPLPDAYKKIHNPASLEDIILARFRFLFNDLFYLASKLEIENRTFSKGTLYHLKTLKNTYQLINSLPYKLTEDQNKVFSDFLEQMRDGKRINALVQGDVGCGKTIVAFLSMFMAADNGYQSVLLAPTNILASQHYLELKQYASQYGYTVAFLHSGLKKSEKKNILKGIRDGNYQFIVGTHSVFSKDVEYNNLALIVTDEEHKFGVEQREALEQKANQGVHTISMSATPIPRSLAQTLYGGVKDVYCINTMPGGRKKVKTQIFQNDNGNYKFISNEIEKGRQAYIVCKYVEDCDRNNVVSTTEAYNKISEYFQNDPNVHIGIVTGKTNKEEADNILKQFQNNEIQILVATTIVEVGVNTPNASVIMIYDADMYGLSQLHQLRGRVGRGEYQGYCILKTGLDDTKTQYRPVPKRLDFFCTTNDGFEIAEEDLKYRGAGDLIGTKQSGFNEYVDKMLCNPILYQIIKEKICLLADYGVCQEIINIAEHETNSM